MQEGHAKLYLLGPFRLVLPDLGRIELPSKRGCALIAMLAMSNNGERTRSWLQDRLWGSREKLQAQNSLRNELSTLRRRLNCGQLTLLRANSNRITLDLDYIDIDARNYTGPGDRRRASWEFLEGIDLEGEEEFEDWLREQRSALADRAGPVAQGAVLRVTSLAAFHRTASLAVLPFSNLTRDPQKEYLAEGIGEELLDRIARLRWMPVISPGQNFRPQPNETTQIVGQRLGSTYVLDGVLRQHDDAYWLSAQVVDSLSGQVVWSTRLLLPSPQASNAMAPLVTEFVAALESRIEHAEQIRARLQPETALGVNELVWRGRWHLNRLTVEDAAEAERYLSEALRLAPNSSAALITYGTHLAYQIWNRRQTGTVVAELRSLAQRAIVVDYDDARGHLLAGIAEMWLRNTAEAETLFRRAIAINPSLVIAYEQLATLDILTGRPAEAIEMMVFALRLGPSDYRLFFKHGEIGLAYLLAGRFEDAVRHAKESIILRPRYWYAHVVRINALVRLGQLSAAADAYRDLVAARPNFSPAYIDWIPFVETAGADYLREGLALVALSG